MLSDLKGRASAALLAVVALAACARTASKGMLIDRYRQAECIPVSFGPGISPPTRAWDYNLTTRQGVVARVTGAEMPGGRIVVTYLADGQWKVAANAGDYVYPADVRFDQNSDLLYVRASGLAVLDGQQTWLFEYDINNRRQTRRERVDPGVLPQECPIK